MGKGKQIAHARMHSASRLLASHTVVALAYSPCDTAPNLCSGARRPSPSCVPALGTHTSPPLGTHQPVLNTRAGVEDDWWLSLSQGAQPQPQPGTQPQPGLSCAGARDATEQA